MNTALIITSSANGDASVSNGLATSLIDRLREADPALHVVLRDVGANPLPHLTAETVAAIKGTYAGTCVLSDLSEPASLVMKLDGAGAPGTIGAVVLNPRPAYLARMTDPASSIDDTLAELVEPRRKALAGSRRTRLMTF